MFVNKTPRFYKIAADYVKKVQENGASLKQLIYSKQHPNIMGLYALVNEVFKHFEQIKYLISHAKLESITTKNPWLIYVLITELLWGKKHLPDIKSTTFLSILSQKQKLEKLVSFAEKNVPTTEKRVNTPKYVRVNTLKVCVSDAIAAFVEEGYNYKKPKNKSDYKTFLSEASSLQEYDFMSDIHFNELLLFHPSCKFFDHKAYQNGLIILQDKASCIPAYLLNPSPGSVVLDACAAPGTKTTLLASLMKDEGTLYAVDRNQIRFQELKSFVEKSGASCVQTIHKDVLNLNGNDFPNVQYILVDPSCSGSGMLDRVGETSVEKTRLKKLQGIQILLLKHCMRHFHDTKRIVYSTCSVHPEENEEVVKDILSSTYNFKLISAKKLLKGPWVNFGSSKYGDIGKNCLYSRPEKDLTNGFFVAVFEKTSNGEVNPYYRKDRVKLFTRVQESDAKAMETQHEKETKLLCGRESRDKKNNNFRLMLRKKKRSTKKTKREIVITENTEKLNPHPVFVDNLSNNTDNVSNAFKEISEIINNEENAGGNNIIEFIKQNPSESTKEEEELDNIKKKRKRVDLESNKTKKIKKSFKETQSSGYIDEKEDENEYVSNIQQQSSNSKANKNKRKLVPNSINGVNDNIVLLDKKPKQAVLKHKHPENDVTDKHNFIVSQRNQQKVFSVNEFKNGAKTKFINSSTITIDAIKVSSEKEKLKNRLLKKTFTFLNRSECNDSEKCTNNNNSVSNMNGNNHEDKPNETMDYSLEDRVNIEHDNKKNAKHIESDVTNVLEENNKGKKLDRKKSKTTMIPFRGIIGNNIDLIRKAEKLDSNEVFEENSIKLDFKNKYSCSKKNKNQLNGNNEIKNIEKGDNKFSTVNNCSNGFISDLKVIEVCDVGIKRKNSKKQSTSTNCETSILNEIVAIVKN